MHKKTKAGRVYLVPACVIYGHKKSRFVKSNYTKPSNQVICGKNGPSHKNVFNKILND